MGRRCSDSSKGSDPSDRAGAVLNTEGLLMAVLRRIGGGGVPSEPRSSAHALTRWGQCINRWVVTLQLLDW